jgi:MFS transporter, CP family, cyanate transporter
LRLERLGLLAGLFLAGLALRPQLVGMGPLIPEIQDDLKMSHAVAGLLGTIPVLCMGVFALPGPLVSRRYGSRLTIAVCLALIGVFGIARALVPGAALVLLLTFGVGLGMGLAQSVMPQAVKERFAHRPAFATAIYATGINVGSATSSAVAVPIADAAGGWRWAVGVFSVVTCGLVVAWVMLTRREPRHLRDDAPHVRPPWRSPLAWVIAVEFGVMSMAFYGINNWIPDAYVERGWSESRAGWLLALLNLSALATTLLVPWFADRFGSRRGYLLCFSAVFTLATAGFAGLEGGAWVWAALAGLSVGALFPLVMTLPLDVAHRPAEVAAVASVMLGAGYSMSALAPLGLGAVRDLTGGYDVTLWLLVAFTGAQFLIASALSRERLARGVIPSPSQAR